MRTTRNAALGVLAICLGLAVAGCNRGGAGGAAAPASGGDDVGDALRAVEQWRQAYESRDVDALSKAYDRGDHVVRVHQGKGARGWTEVENKLRIALGRATSIHVRLTDVHVAPLAAGALAVTAAMSREVSDGVTTITDTGVVSLALRADGDRWLVVSEHYSFGPPGS